MLIQALPTVSCTVQPHPLGGYTPTLHLRGTGPGEPTSTQPAFVTLADAIRFARTNYRIRSVMVPQPSTGEAA